MEGKRNETLLLGLEGQCEADAEKVSAQYKSANMRVVLRQKRAASGSGGCPITRGVLVGPRWPLLGYCVRV